MTINEYFKTQYRTRRGAVIDQVVCNDGFTMSVQASQFHYCSPRVDLAESYDSVEVGFPSLETKSLHHTQMDQVFFHLYQLELLMKLFRNMVVL